MSDSTPSGSILNRTATPQESSFPVQRRQTVSFAPLPPPPRERRNSITIGVAARGQMLATQSKAQPKEVRYLRMNDADWAEYTQRYSTQPDGSETLPDIGTFAVQSSKKLISKLKTLSTSSSTSSGSRTSSKRSIFNSSRSRSSSTTSNPLRPSADRTTSSESTPETSSYVHVEPSSSAYTFSSSDPNPTISPVIVRQPSLLGIQTPRRGRSPPPPSSSSVSDADEEDEEEAVGSTDEEDDVVGTDRFKIEHLNEALQKPPRRNGSAGNLWWMDQQEKYAPGVARTSVDEGESTPRRRTSFGERPWTPSVEGKTPNRAFILGFDQLDADRAPTYSG